MLCLLLALTPATAKKRKHAKQAPLAAYLMVYHKDADHSLHMALSRDGRKWTALNDDHAVVSGDTIAQQHGIRDVVVAPLPPKNFSATLRGRCFPSRSWI